MIEWCGFYLNSVRWNYVMSYHNTGIGFGIVFGSLHRNCNIFWRIFREKSILITLCIQTFWLLNIRYDCSVHCELALVQKVQYAKYVSKTAWCGFWTQNNFIHFKTANNETVTLWQRYDTVRYSLLAVSSVVFIKSDDLYWSVQIR